MSKRKLKFDNNNRLAVPTCSETSCIDYYLELESSAPLRWASFKLLRRAKELFGPKVILADRRTDGQRVRYASNNV